MSFVWEHGWNECFFWQRMAWAENAYYDLLMRYVGAQSWGTEGGFGPGCDEVSSFAEILLLQAAIWWALMSFVWEHGWNECFFCGKAKVQHKMHSTGFHRPWHSEHWECEVRWSNGSLCWSSFQENRVSSSWRRQDGKTVWITSNRSRPSNLEGRFRLECGNQQVNGRNSMTKSAKHGKFEGPPFPWIIQLGHFTRLRRGLPSWKAAASTVQSRVDKFFRCWWHLQGAMASKMGTEGNADFRFQFVSDSKNIRVHNLDLLICWWLDQDFVVDGWWWQCGAKFSDSLRPRLSVFKCTKLVVSSATLW